MIEAIVKKLCAKFNIVVIKHIHHRNFDVDKVGSDTWRAKNAGAKIVVGISPDKLFLNADVNSENLNLALDLINVLSMRFKVDLILLEGFYSQVKKMSDVKRILVVKDLREINELLNRNFVKNKNFAIFCRKCENDNFKGIPIFHSLDDVIKFIFK